MRLCKLASLAATCLLPLASGALPQSSTATLNGTITDENGAVIADARITLTNVAAGQARTTSSNGAGFYTFPLLKPYTYRLRVERPGFASVQQENVLLQVGDTVVLDLSLKVGGVGETVQVTASTAPLLETGSSNLGEVVNSRTIESLPLNGRNVIQLVALTPGISTTRRYRTSAFGSGSITNRTACFPGNIIPADRLTPDGRALAKAYEAMALLAGVYTDTPTANNATYELSSPFDFRQDIIRLAGRGVQFDRA